MSKLILLIPFFLIGCSDKHKDFFIKVKEESILGAKWHYITPRSPDPKALSIPLEYTDPETGEVYHKKLVLFKLQ